MKQLRPYIAPRGLNFEARLLDWAKNAERRFEARMVAGGADLELAILDAIGIPWLEGSITAVMVQRALARHPDAKRITVLINSPGGYCDEGVGIYNLLARHPAEVTVEVIGEAASAASVIAMAGNKVVMRPGTWMMVHPAMCGTMGSAVDHRKSAEYLDTLTDGAIDIYVRRTKREEKKIRALVEAETWMSAAEAKELGFADELVDDDAAPAKDSGPNKDDRGEDDDVDDLGHPMQRAPVRPLAALSSLSRAHYARR